MPAFARMLRQHRPALSSLKSLLSSPFTFLRSSSRGSTGSKNFHGRDGLSASSKSGRVEAEKWYKNETERNKYEMLEGRHGVQENRHNVSLASGQYSQHLPIQGTNMV